MGPRPDCRSRDAGARAVLFIGFALVLALALPTTARADAKQECSDAYQKTQVFRAADELEEAIEQAERCTRTCTKSFLDECIAWKTELEGRLASIIVEAVDASGARVTEGSVSLDGVPWLDQLGGPARVVSKGPHTLEISVDGGPPQKKSIVIREGEKNRKIAVSIVTPAPEPPSMVHSVGPWVVGGLGAATLVAGAITGGFVLDAYSVTEDQCNATTATCETQAGVDASERGQLLGPVTTGLFIGGGALVTAGIIWLVAAPSRPSTTAMSLTIAPNVSRHQAGVLLGGSF